MGSADSAVATQFLESVLERVERSKREAKEQGLRFNIFDLLGLTSDEVRCHSTFLAELLNPEGTHGQDECFLNLFLDQVRRLSHPAAAGLSDSGPSTDCRVYVERPCPAVQCGGEIIPPGRIDIIIELRDTWVIIENKIGARDQHRQLERYKLYAQAARKAPILCYLTLDGRDPGPCSLGGLLPNQVVPLGYAGFINEWLDECVKAVGSVPSVREPISQYQRLIRRLSGGGLRKELTMEIVDQIKTPRLLEAALEIERAAREARVRVHLAFWNELEQSLTNACGPLQSIENFAPTREKVRRYHAKPVSDSDRCFGLGIPLVGISEGRWFVLLITVWKNLYYGLTVVDGGKWDDSTGMKPEEKRRAEEAFRSIYPAAEAGDWSVKGLPRTKLPFAEFGPECINLADPQIRESRVREIVEDVVEMIEPLKCRLAGLDRFTETPIIEIIKSS